MKNDIFILMVLFLSLSPSVGVSLTYNEGIDGDFENFGRTTIDLDIGENTIIGSSMFSSSSVNDFDPFVFTIPDGTKITEIYYEYTPVNNTGYSWFNDVTRIQKYFPNVVNDTGVNTAYIDIASGPSLDAIDPGYLPVTTEYRWAQHYQYATDESGLISWNYVKTIVVAPVPLPASFALFISALGILGVLRNRAIL